MNPEALPPALSELFLPEARSADSRTDQAGQPSSPDAADRFERYLSSARQTVGGNQPLPVAAAADDGLLAPTDVGRKPAERSARPERPASTTDERRRVDDRSTDTDDRRDPVGERDRTEAMADDGRVDRADDRGPSEDQETTSATDADRTEASTDDESAEVRADEETEVAEADGDGAGPDLAATEVDLSLVPAAADAGADGQVTDLRAASDTIVEEDATADSDVVVADPEAEASVFDDHLDRSADPAAVVAAASTVTTTTENDIESGEGTVEVSIDTDATVLDEASADIDRPATYQEATATEADVDLTEGDQADGGADAGPDLGAGNQGSNDADTGQATTEPATVDGPDVAPALGPVATTNTGPTATSTGPGTGVDGVAALAGPRTRSTATTSTTQGAQQAQAPLAEGEAGDPLWLQVRRAMGSLRTLQNGEQQMTIRLRPAELGSVMVRVNAGENGTTVSLIADSAVAANQLNQQRQQLIAELEQGGLAGVAVDVGTGGETDLRDGAGDGETSNDADSDGSAAAAAVAGAGAGARTGGRGRRAGGSSGSLLDVEL